MHNQDYYQYYQVVGHLKNYCQIDKQATMCAS